MEAFKPVGWHDMEFCVVNKADWSYSLCRDYDWRLLGLLGLDAVC